MRIFSRKSAIIFAAVFVVFCAVSVVSACTIREEAMPQLRETQKYIDFFVKASAGLFAGIVALYFLNIIVNRKWKLMLLFPFSALAIFLVSFVYTLIFAPMGFCGLGEIYRTSLTVLILMAILFVCQLILFVKLTRNRNFKAV